MPDMPSANASAVCDHLHAQCSQGWRCLERDDPQAACETFRRLIATGADESARGTDLVALQVPLLRAVEGLSRCLPALDEDPQARRQALEAVFQAFDADVAHGANGVAKEASFLLLRHAVADERAELAARARRELAACRDAPRAEQYWRLLLDLEALDPASLDGVFAQCRAAGQAGLVAEKLIDLDRVGEALSVVRKELRTTEELLRFAESPAARGQARAVMALVQERLAKAFDARLAAWLAERYAERGELPRALDIHVRLLRAAPERADWLALEDLAHRLGCWERLRPQVERAQQQARKVAA